MFEPNSTMNAKLYALLAVVSAQVLTVLVLALVLH